MKAITNPLTALLLLLITTGCVSSYKHVMVSVVDSTTGTPVSGAKISTAYVAPRATLLASRRTSEAITDATGKVVLSANYSRRGPTPLYRMFIMNDTYREQSCTAPSPLTKETLLARSADFIPTKPDIVMKVASEDEIARRRVKFEENQKADEQKADELFLKSPDFWPKHKKAPYPWPEDRVGKLLLSKRWQAVSTVSLGTKEDIDLIRALVVRHMAHPKAKIGAIGWLSPSLVMVSSGWYTGPLASAGYTYVLQKGKDGWTVVAYYMDYIS